MSIFAVGGRVLPGNFTAMRKLAIILLTVTLGWAQQPALAAGSAAASAGAGDGARLSDPAVGRVLCSEPGRVFADLPASTRAEMLAYYIGGRVVPKDTDLGEKARLDTVTNDFLRITTSVCRSVQLRLLTKGGRDTVVAVVEKVKTPVPDSRISFYDTRWRELSAKKVMGRLPRLADFVRRGADAKKAAVALADVDFPMMTLDFEGPGFGTLVARQRLKEFYSASDYKRLAPVLADEVRYAVSGAKLVRQ